MPLIDHQYLKDIESELQESEDRPSLNWSTAANTHIGRVRPSNEDAFFYSEEQGLWVVADGMGGLNRGDRASKAVVDNIRSFVRFDNIVENIKDLETRCMLANTACRIMFRRNVIGSTVAALQAFKNYAFFLWAGDSRVYRLRNGVLEQITEDHSVAQEKVQRGQLSPEEAENHPQAHVLTRAIGVHEHLRIEMLHSVVLPGDRYLLCSDGLYNDVNRHEIQSLLAETEPDESLKGLIDLALDRGGRDNITAIVAQAN